MIRRFSFGFTRSFTHTCLNVFRIRISFVVGRHVFLVVVFVVVVSLPLVLVLRVFLALVHVRGIHIARRRTAHIDAVEKEK